MKESEGKEGKEKQARGIKRQRGERWRKIEVWMTRERMKANGKDMDD